MSNGRKQFAVYRLKKGFWENEALRYRSWNYLQKFHVQVQADRYEQICVSPFSWELDPSDLCRQLENGLPAASSGEKLEVSDVLAVTKDGITTAYYVDPEKLIVLTGFFHTTASTALLSIDTTDYQIEGRAGNFLAADEIWIDGQHFFLMQSQQFGKNAAYVVLDSNGKVAAEDTTVGFTEEVIRQIRAYMERQNAARSQPVRTSPIPPLENWQKSYENGEYLRSAEMAEEQNYSMIDGRMNNMPPKPIIYKRRTGRKRKNGRLPVKGRESVLKRLKQYQTELAMQRGQPTMGHEEPEAVERKM